MASPADSIHHDSDAIICPACKQTARVGELVCSNCGTVLTTAGKTRKLEGAVPTGPSKVDTQTRGQLAVAGKRKLQFKIGSQEVLLPVAETFTVGRIVPGAGGDLPDVDLTPFGADIKGVSRMHLKVQWRGILPYITDLRSTNGTTLNGHQLAPGVERIIHDGDEVWLGHLDLIVLLE